MTEQEVKACIRDVPDFPIKGILFKDLTTAFINPACMKWFEESLYELYKNTGATKVVGLESRGFIIAPILANRIGAGFVPIRKKGKLPAEVVTASYTKEYGVDTIEIHKDALNENDIVILHDDLLATGGSMAAALQLVQKFHVKRVYINFLVELDDLGGRKLLDPTIEVQSLLHY